MFFKGRSCKKDSEPWRMDEFHQALDEYMTKNGIADDVDPSLSEKYINAIIESVGSLFLTRAKNTAKGMLREHRRIEKGFIERNQIRWGPGFDRIEMLLVMSTEAAQAIDNALRSGLTDENRAKFDAVQELTVRGLRVAREIYSLMRNGFADGALARWRTLHEVAIAAQFLAKDEPVTSQRYLMSRNVQAHKAAQQYLRYQERANLAPFDPEHVENIRIAYEETVLKYGPEMKGDWGWASPTLGIEEPSFFDLERHLGLDHWRPRYKWACDDTHGNHRPNQVLLANVENDGKISYIAGPSNSGMPDPAQMLAHSVVQLMASFILIGPNVDRLGLLSAMEALRDEIAEVFIEREAETLDRHRAKSRRLIDRLSAYLERICPKSVQNRDKRENISN